jgi:hypothetical protein
MATAFKPSDAAYTAAASPAGPAPTIVKSYSDSNGAETIPSPAATPSIVAGASRTPLGRTQTGSWSTLSSPADSNAPTCAALWAPSTSTQIIGDAVAAEKVADAITDRGSSVPDKQDLRSDDFSSTVTYWPLMSSS